MEDSKTTFYQRHPKLANTAITVGLVGGLVGLIGGGAAIYHEKNEAKELSSFKKEIAEKYNPAHDMMRGMRMRMREQMPMYRMGMDIERMLGREMMYLKPETRLAFKELYQRNQEFMKKYDEILNKYKGDFMNYRKEFAEDLTKLTNEYLKLSQEKLAGVVGGVVGIYGGITSEPVRATGDIKPPKLLKMIEPVYPEVARQSRVEGIVILEAQTDVNGHVTNTKVRRSIPLLDQAAIDAVKQWVYEPKIIDGKPRGVVFTVTVRFQLK